MPTLGSAIRDARRTRGMTQERLALESGLQRKTIYEVENGKTDPRLTTIQRIAETLDLSPGDLLASSSRVGPV